MTLSAPLHKPRNSHMTTLVIYVGMFGTLRTYVCKPKIYVKNTNLKHMANIEIKLLEVIIREKKIILILN